MSGLVSAKACFSSVHTSEGVVLGVMYMGETSKRLTDLMHVIALTKLKLTKRASL